MNIIEGVAVSNHCDYSFVDQAGTQVNQLQEFSLFLLVHLGRSVCMVKQQKKI